MEGVQVSKTIQHISVLSARVPETATVLMSGGISFGDLNEEQVGVSWLPVLSCVIL